MEIYFVRHGQTNSNLAERYQHEKTQLNETGVEQVESIAKEIQALKPTRVITSLHLRAVETARILTKGTDIIPETNFEFGELKNPSWLVGSRFSGLNTFIYVAYWFFGRFIKGGESYHEFYKRIKRAQKILEDLPEDERVVIVSHSVFINVFTEHLCLEKKISFRQASLVLFRIFTLRNAGIIHLHFDRGDNICGWTIIKG